MILLWILILAYSVVKLTSPRLNYILIAGGYLMFLSLYPRLIPHTGKSINEFRCIVRDDTHSSEKEI